MPITDQYSDGLASVDADTVADPSDYDTFVAVFARTYAHSEDPAAIVDLYHDYQQVRASNPNAGSSKLATKLGVSRSTIRKWVDDNAVPYVVQGLQTAEERGWIPMAFDTETFRAMNKLVAWVMSSGSIHRDRWSVQFVVDGDSDRERLERIVDALDLSVIEAEEPGTGLQGSLLGVTPDGSVLGRVLHSLGAPRGGKTDADLSLPAYLDAAPNRVVREFLWTYLQNRRRGRDDGESWISFGENRPQAFKQSFVELVDRVTGADASISGNDIYVGADAVAVLDQTATRYEQLGLSENPTPLVRPKALIGTYGELDEQLSIVDQYRRFMAADGFWTNVAREEGIPQSRAERWKGGATPNAVGAVDVATAQGWLDTEWTDTVDAIAELVIGLHAAGSLNQGYIPSWSVDGEYRQQLQRALQTVGVGVKERPTGALTPAENAAALGRALVVAGAPHPDGRNTEQLPDWVFLADAERHAGWLRAIVNERGAQFKDRSPTRNISFDGPQSYFGDIAVLIETVTGVDSHLHESRVTVPADAVRELGLA